MASERVFRAERSKTRVGAAARRRTAALAAVCAKARAASRGALSQASERRAKAAAALEAAAAAGEKRRSEAAQRRASRFGSMSAGKALKEVSEELKAGAPTRIRTADLEAAATRRRRFMESRVQVARTYAVERVERAHKQRAAAQATVFSDFEVAEAHRDAAGARRRVALSERVEVAALLGSGRVANARANRAAAAKARSAAVEARMTFRAAEAARRRRAKRASIIRAARRGRCGSAAVAADAILCCGSLLGGGLGIDSETEEVDAYAAERLAERLARADQRRQAFLAERGAMAKRAAAKTAAIKAATISETTQREMLMVNRQRLASDRRNLKLWTRSRMCAAMGSPPAAASAEALAATAAARLEALEARLADATARREDVVSAVYYTARRMGSERVLRARRRSAAKEFVVLKRSARRQAVASARRLWLWQRKATAAAALGSDRVQYAAMRRDVAAERELKAQLLRGLRREDAANRRGVLLKIRSVRASLMGLLLGPHGSAVSVPESTEKNARSSDNKRGETAIPRSVETACPPLEEKLSSDAAKRATRLEAKLERAAVNRNALLARTRRCGRAWANRRAAAAARRCMRRMNRVARALQAEQRSLSATTKRQACLQKRAAAAAAAAKPGLSPEKAAMVLAKSPTKDAKPTRLELSGSPQPKRARPETRTPESAAERRAAALEERVRKARADVMRHAMVVEAAREERAARALNKRRRLEAKLERAKALREASFKARGGCDELMVIGKRLLAQSGDVPVALAQSLSDKFEAASHSTAPDDTWVVVA